MPKISINIDSDILKELERRAKKEYLTIKELIEDIIRRSAITSKSRRQGKYIPETKGEKFIEYFSRYQPYKRRKKQSQR